MANNDRYHVVFRDGKSQRGRDLKDVFQRGRPPRLNGRDLFDKKNPALVLRDTNGSVQLEAPYVEFTNGDILPGTVTALRTQSSASRSDAHYLVTVREPWVMSHRKDKHRVASVRSRMVRKVVRWGTATREYVSGLVVLRNGKQIVAKSIRLADDTLRLLTKTGIQTIRIGRVAEYHLPNRDSFTAKAVDLHWNRLGEQTLLDTVRTTDGGRITFPYSMVHRDSHWVVVMPVWSVDSLAIRYEMIATHTFRTTDSLPLTSLPMASTNAQISGSSYRWRRNRSVNGATLASGELSTDSGVGVHGTAALKFLLPKDAVEFESYVGLNRSVGDGGCVTCLVAKDSSDGPKLWQSGHLRGSDGLRRAGPFSIKGAKSILLVSDMAHQGRPSGADPLDIRDHVDWLLPRIKFSGRSISDVRIKASPWLTGL
ncbi:MAG: NPCBM/NEW2 domain-containing protein, partial [Pirellulales bacterium]|nr:NPCBM/NEW2 domain-containing protein [Pirellulales bacterium]